ncbi:MAG TPA: hypothetical protein VHQ66_12145, partial [Myxococcota bacterium]|nr:hypothetical protein [Myxococcota bacterium]
MAVRKSGSRRPRAPRVDDDADVRAEAGAELEASSRDDAGEELGDAGDDDEGFEELESSAVFEALRQVDRDTLLAELGVSDVDQDDGEDDEEV